MCNQKEASRNLPLNDYVTNQRYAIIVLMSMVLINI